MPELNLTIQSQTIDKLAARIDALLQAQAAAFWAGVWVGALSMAVLILLALSRR